MSNCEQCKVSISEHLIEELGAHLCRKCAVIQQNNPKSAYKSPQDQTKAKAKTGWFSGLFGRNARSVNR